MHELKKRPAKSLWQKMWEPKDIHSLAPAQKIITYTLLAFWTFVVLFPLYWLFITSFKLPIHVADGPYYLPFIDFEPSLHAWEYIFIDLGQDTLRPYLNSIIVALMSTLLAVFIGSMAAYALTRIEYKPNVGSIVGFIAIVALVVYLTVSVGLAWPLTVSIGGALFILFAFTFNRHFKRSLGNNDILFWIISQRIMGISKNLAISAIIPI